MRALEKNKRKIYYALYNGKTSLTDSQGYLTGEFSISYGQITSMYINISPGRGESDLELFGTNISYDHVMTTTDLNCPINENAVVWYEKEPYDNNNKTTPYNYIVVKKSTSLNSITYALQGVDVKNA